MVDRDKIEGLIRHLRQYTTYLQEIVEQDREDFLKDPKSVGSARYYLQVSIETCIGIANHIIATDRLRAPQDYKDSFKVLNEAGILPDEFTRTMREMAGLRNLLVHLYWDVDDQVIYEGIRSELSDFETFVGYVLAYMDKGMTLS
jgi:uncharacterized protein YutE (UPF0331/DUF86 family)